MSAITPPKLPKLIVNSSGKYKYVFTYKNRWDKEVKRSTRGKGDTHCVGNLVSLIGLIAAKSFSTMSSRLSILR